MNTDLIPANDLRSYAPVFGMTAVLDNVALTFADRAAATRYLDKHAPDLRAMILGVAA